MKIDALDHMVLTVQDIDATCGFYCDVLGMARETFVAPSDGSRRVALLFGGQKINLHKAGAEFEPKAKTPQPGSADFCLLTKTPLEDVTETLIANGIAIELDPSPRTGAAGPLVSIYCRDPDGNLVEISNVMPS